MSFYDSKQWKKTRAAVLARDSYMCQFFKRYGKTKPANTVHHIFPRSEFPEYQWKRWNLISLSQEAHGRMHDRNTDELTEAGQELLRRTARANGIEIPEKYIGGKR